MKNAVFLWTLLLASLTATAQVGDPDSLVIRAINGNTADPALAVEPDDHLVFYNPTAGDKGRLMLYLMGTFDNPPATTYFPSLAANNGIRSIVLNYKNGVPAGVCANSINLNCHTNFRQEVVFGTNNSLLVNVDTVNSIYRRFEKLLQYLHANFPAENWDQFLDNSQVVDWTHVTTAGHSQGGGHAAYLAKAFALERALSFASPNEFNANQGQTAPWISNPGATSPSSFYVFGNLYDEIVDFPRLYSVWTDLNLLQFGDSLLVDGRECPDFSSHILYTEDTSTTTGVSPFHSLVVRDAETPLDSAGVPVFQDVWKYMLGICDSVVLGQEAPLSNLAPATFDWRSPLLHVSSEGQIKAIQYSSLLGNPHRIELPPESAYAFSLTLPKGLYFFQLEYRDGETTHRKILLR